MTGSGLGVGGCAVGLGAGVSVCVARGSGVDLADGAGVVVGVGVVGVVVRLGEWVAGSPESVMPGEGVKLGANVWVTRGLLGPSVDVGVVETYAVSSRPAVSKCQVIPTRAANSTTITPTRTRISHLSLC